LLADFATEAEFTKLMEAEAMKSALPAEKANTAFARYYSAPESLELRKAIQICKSVPAPLFDVQPVQTGGAAATNSDEDRSKAMLQLTAMAAELVRRSPTLSDAQAFARVFENPENSGLANLAHRRPTAADDYRHPTV
jgi:hypothetical protein